MPPRKGYNNNNNNGGGGSKHGRIPQTPQVVNAELIATEEERVGTSASMYFDYKCRVNTHPSYIGNERRIRKFISLFETATKSKRVLFVAAGMGFGLLPMLCAKNGAARVIALDDSAVIPQCASLAKDNKLDTSVLTFIQGKLGKVALPEDCPDNSFDFVFCDWASTFLTNDLPVLEECLLARDRYLKPGGELLPRRASLHAVGISDYEYQQSTVEWWSGVYGFQMETMKECVRKEPAVGSVPNSTVATDKANVVTIDIMDLKTAADAKFAANFELKTTRPKTVLHFLTLYPSLDYVTNKGEGFTESCGPTDMNGSLSQVSFCLPQYVPMMSRDVFKVGMSFEPHPGTTPPRVEIKFTGECNGQIATTKCDRTYLYSEYK
eukprot:PhM_4_TR15873/c0_g1_i1/m.84833/K11434/PRMT1; type I protein arginine methyltransferase